MLKEVGGGECYIRSTALHGFAETVSLAGWDAETFLVEAGIPAHVLQGEETLISWQKLGHLLEIAARHCDNPAFGLEWATRMPPPYAGAGPISLLAGQSKTVGEWLERTIRYWRFHTNAFSLRLVEAPPIEVKSSGHASRRSVALRFDNRYIMRPGRQLMEYMLGGARAIAAGMADLDDRMFLAVRFPHLAPADLDPYRKAFRCRLEFSADHYELVLDRSVLELPLAVTSTVLSSYFGAFLEYQMQRQEQYDQSITATVKLAVASLMGAGLCTLEFVAEAMDISPKKLQRLLAQEDTSFSEVCNIVRRDTAYRMIAETDAPLSSVAGLLDYASIVPFSYAFRRWSGFAPTAFRKRARLIEASQIALPRDWWRKISRPVERTRQRRR